MLCRIPKSGTSNWWFLSSKYLGEHHWKCKVSCKPVTMQPPAHSWASLTEQLIVLCKCAIHKVVNSATLVSIHKAVDNAWDMTPSNQLSCVRVLWWGHWWCSTLSNQLTGNADTMMQSAAFKLHLHALLFPCWVFFVCQRVAESPRYYDYVLVLHDRAVNCLVLATIH